MRFCSFSAEGQSHFGCELNSGVIVDLREAARQLAASGGLLDRVEVSGDGAPWVRALLDGVDLNEAGNSDVPVTERRGIVRVGNPSGGSGVLERRELLKRVTEEYRDASREAAKRGTAQEEAEIALQNAEDELEQARAAREAAEDQHRTVHGELAA